MEIVFTRSTISIKPAAYIKITLPLKFFSKYISDLHMFDKLTLAGIPNGISKIRRLRQTVLQNQKKVGLLSSKN